jgi:hypothetical protein
MIPTLTLLTAVLAAPKTSYTALDNLSFRAGNLSRWEGKGFLPTTTRGAGPNLSFGVTSSDNGRRGHKALLHRTILVPPGAGALRFRAAAMRPRGVPAGDRLDVFLEAAGRRIIPKQVRTNEGFLSTSVLLPRTNGRLREYQWSLDGLAGQYVRITLVDDDDRPDCFVLCGGFRLVPQEDGNARAFTRHMVQLARDKHLAPMARYDSKHFLAISNATEDDTERRLYNCELLYDLFYDHFRRKGFAIRTPGSKLMVALFNSQEGFEAYLGSRLSSSITGLYHPQTNRLVVYDYATNRAFVESKERGGQAARGIANGLERQRIVGEFSRAAQTHRNDTNLGTIMHEAAHQLSFNSGLLNREGDVALWLAEGLACYCEPTQNGDWQGVGAANPQRATALGRVVRGGGKLIPLKDLIASDDWLRKATTVDQVLLGYAQSWALFRLLMEERPRALRQYLAVIYARRTAEHRLADFVENFGADLAKLETRYQAYVRGVVADQTRTR